MLGIDEAGRGAVFGPLVYGAAFWPIKDDGAITALGYDDSKKLTEEKREAFFRGIRQHPKIGWIIDSIPAAKISSSMLQRTPCSLNETSHNSAASMVQKALDIGINVQKVSRQEQAHGA